MLVEMQNGTATLKDSVELEHMYLLHNPYWLRVFPQKRVCECLP